MGVVYLAERDDGTAYYRCRKFVRRHRWRLVTALVAGVAALGAAFTIWSEGRRAELRFNDVRSLAHSVIFELHDAIQDLPGSTAARKLLVDRALPYLRKLESAGQAEDVELQLDLATAEGRRAGVRTRPRHSLPSRPRRQLDL